MNTTIKKQNRILLAALIVILSAAAILIAVTGGANRKEANTPPAETSIPSETGEKGSSERTSRKTIPEDTAGEQPSAEDRKSNAKIRNDEKEEDSVKIEESEAEAAAVQSLSDTLPVFAVPVDNFVIKDFSEDVPVFSATMNDYRIHNGIDIACSSGTPVYSAADGFICEIYQDPMMGVTVGVQHSGGAVTRYRGLAEDTMNLLNTGDEVKRGQVIGASGETALIESAEEGHLHFELCIQGEAVDPGDYMKLTYLADVYEG